MEKEQRRFTVADCGHRVNEGEYITYGGGPWGDEPWSKCEPCFERWQKISADRFARLTPRQRAQLLGGEI